MVFTVSYGAYLPNAIELRFMISSVKIKHLRRFGRFYLLRVSTSKRSPKRMQPSLIVGIAFGFWLISDLPISGWSGFPHFRLCLFPVYVTTCVCVFSIHGLTQIRNVGLNWFKRRSPRHVLKLTEGIRLGDMKSLSNRTNCNFSGTRKQQIWCNTVKPVLSGHPRGML